MMKLLIALATALTSSAAMAATFTFTNHTHYVFLKNAQTPVCASSPISSPCQDVIGPEESEQFTIPSGGENIVFSANYAGGAYFGFYVSNQNGKLSVDTKALNEKYASHNMQGSFADNTLTMSATDSPVPVVYGTKLALHGINLSGAEAGQGEDYMTNLGWWIPSYEDAVPYLQTGANTVRFPIRWGYIDESNEPGAYLDAVYAEVLDLLTNNVTVILDLHNYMRKFDINMPTGGNGGPAPVSPDQIQQVWTKIATKFKGLATQFDGRHGQFNQLIFEVMNEPNQMDMGRVVANDNAGISAIRAQGLKNLILVEGNNWSGLHSWLQDQGYGINVDNIIPSKIYDPGNNWAVAVHQYFDKNYSGTDATCAGNDKFATDLAMQDFVKYMHDNHLRVVIDEFGVPNQPTNPETCSSDVGTLLSDVNQYAVPLNDQSSGGFIGWTAWQAGHGYAGVDALTPTIWQNYYKNYIK